LGIAEEHTVDVELAVALHVNDTFVFGHDECGRAREPVVAQVRVDGFVERVELGALKRVVGSGSGSEPQPIANDSESASWRRNFMG